MAFFNKDDKTLCSGSLPPLSSNEDKTEKICQCHPLSEKKG